jgi:hypothetical protein
MTSKSKKGSKKKDADFSVPSTPISDSSTILTPKTRKSQRNALGGLDERTRKTLAKSRLASLENDNFGMSAIDLGMNMSKPSSDSKKDDSQKDTSEVSVSNDAAVPISNFDPTQWGFTSDDLGSSDFSQDEEMIGGSKKKRKSTGARKSVTPRKKGMLAEQSISGFGFSKSELRAKFKIRNLEQVLAGEGIFPPGFEPEGIAPVEGVNYYSVAAKPSKKPKRHFCSVCGYVFF